MRFWGRHSCNIVPASNLQVAENLSFTVDDGRTGVDPYHSRRITLDAGLTVLALRGLQSRRESYPFIERHIRWRGLSLVFRNRFATWFPTVHVLVTAYRSRT
jgi:hypothetical protein